MNLKRLKIRDMASPYANGIKAKAAKRDEEKRRQEEADRQRDEEIRRDEEAADAKLENILKKQAQKLEPIADDVFDTICDLYDNGFGDEVVTEMDILRKKYGITTDTHEAPNTGSGDFCYMTYRLPNDDGTNFCVMFYEFGPHGGISIDFGFEDGEIYGLWYSENDGDRADFLTIYRYCYDEIVEKINHFGGYFYEFLSWVKSEFGD